MIQRLIAHLSAFSMKTQKKEKSADSVFPLSALSSTRGSRRLAREKVLQILAACETAGCSWREVFQHIFFREFTFDSKDAENPKKLLTPEEIFELEADVPIIWKDEDIAYTQDILNIVENNREEYDEIIERVASNWQFDRTAFIDRQLLRIAFSELTKRPDIPVKVTINEVIELSKRYSTDKSNVFINGILDTALDEFIKAGKAVKYADESVSSKKT